jgi:Tol biopolymer transport system component/tRNA A-37 threonylcarbamoyl transferase component Bud32
MPLGIGTRLGAYDVVSLLGAGGMGEVYRATDTVLKRQVALKVLPPEVANDQERIARFQREAEVLASLNHPNIAHLYGVEKSHGTFALVMELVEGETLADRLTRGPVPVDEALPIAKQIAEALHAAHEHGIIHRDLKPANVKVNPDGAVKILDFGLAKAMEPVTSRGGSAEVLANSPTITSPALMTGVGVLLGTAAYMAPEQAKGRAADKRSDVWAFGCVVYEMLTGTRAFAGEDVSDTLAAVLRATPDWSALPTQTPAAIRTLLRRCLEKDRRRRLADVADAQLDIEDSIAAPDASVAAVAAPLSQHTLSLHWVVAAVLAALLVGGAVVRLVSRPAIDSRPEMRVLLDVQPAESVARSARVRDAPAGGSTTRPTRTAMVLTPDGRAVIFAGVKADVVQLFLRRFDQPFATPIAGTEGAVGPFLSPKGDWVGFWADDKLKKVPVAGGPAVTICDARSFPGLFGATWGDHDTIVFSTAPGPDQPRDVGLMKVSAEGGTAQPLTTPDPRNKELRHLLPAWLPDERALLYTVATTDDFSRGTRIVVQTMTSGEHHVVLDEGTDPRYLSTGHLLYMKGGVLMAAPFDAATLRVTGPAVAMLDGVMHALNAPNSNSETAAGQFAVSASGLLAYIHGGIIPDWKDQGMWVDRRGTEVPVSEPPASFASAFNSPRISPDNQRVVLGRSRTGSRAREPWIYDVRRGGSARLSTTDSNAFVWAPDSQRLLGRRLTGGLVVLSLDGSRREEIDASPNFFPSSWSSAGNLVMFASTDGKAWVMPMDGRRQPHIALEAATPILSPVLSDDGRLIAYASNESGQSEIYVQSPGRAGEWPSRLAGALTRCGRTTARNSFISAAREGW